MCSTAAHLSGAPISFVLQAGRNLKNIGKIITRQRDMRDADQQSTVDRDSAVASLLPTGVVHGHGGGGGGGLGIPASAAGSHASSGGAGPSGIGRRPRHSAAAALPQGLAGGRGLLVPPSETPPKRVAQGGGGPQAGGVSKRKGSLDDPCATLLGDGV